MKKMRTKKIITAGVICLLTMSALNAQQKEWTLTECINYALNENIQVRKAGISENIGEISLRQAQDQRWPSLSASAGENFGWRSIPDSSGGSTFKGSGSTSLSLSSGVTLFNGFQTQNNIKKAELSYKELQYSTEQTKESISLNVMNAYLQVLYAEEQVVNSRNQADATREELGLAAERQKLGAISNSDYLQVKTQLASDELTLANAVNNLEMSKVTLMQLMELPVGSAFSISRPDIDAIISTTPVPDALSVYETALQVKPQVKSAEIGRESSAIDLEIAKGGYFPTISANAGLSTSFIEVASMGAQLKDKFSPSVGLSASIPIFRNNQTRTSVERAKASITTAELDELNTRNQLRKEIEQACLDARSAVISYEAAVNQHEASRESYNVAEEKYRLGSMNSIDFLIQKASMISSQSKLLQAKYEVVYCYKIIDFYKGTQLSF